MCEQCMIAVERCYPHLSEAERCEVLWSATCFPFCAPEEVERQLADMKSSTDGSLGAALAYADKLMEIAMKEVRQMGKEERLKNLRIMLSMELPWPLYEEARIMLNEFIYGFKLKKNHDTEGRFLHRVWYKLVAIPIFLDGYIRDVRLNHMIGRRLFGKHYRFGTLTATLKRAKENAPKSSKEHDLAVQICEVLNDYDQEHC